MVTEKISTSNIDPNFQDTLIRLFRLLLSAATCYPDGDTDTQVAVKVDSEDIENGYLIAVRDSDETPDHIRQAAKHLYQLIVDLDGVTDPPNGEKILN